ncbi:MAG: carboxypeptidase-like regulatory domain-containing protein [Bacteroidota bacterium]
MKSKLVFLLFILLTVNLTAGNENDDKSKNSTAKAKATVSIDGQVQDFTSGEALPGVELRLKESGKKVFTDFDGNFSFDRITPGTYNIVISYISYNKSLVEEIEVSRNPESLSIKLKDAR